MRQLSNPRPVEPKMLARIRRGSTLVELLIVVAIIALLMAALVPSLRRSLLLARNTVCMHNLHMLGLSLQQYRFDYDGWLPTDGRASTESDESTSNSEVWFVKLYPSYMADPMLLTCPEDPFRFRMNRVQDIRREPRVANLSSYGINSYLLQGAGGTLADLDRRQPTRPLDVILAADMGPDDVRVRTSPDDPLAGPDRNLSLLTWDDGYMPIDPVDETSSPWVTARHSGRINMLTISGGVRPAYTKNTLQGPIQRYYEDCARAQCTFCTELHLFHYTFAKDGLYWWTGPAPIE